MGTYLRKRELFGIAMLFLALGIGIGILITTDFDPVDPKIPDSLKATSGSHRAKPDLVIIDDYEYVTEYLPSAPRVYTLRDTIEAEQAAFDTAAVLAATGGKYYISIDSIIKPFYRFKLYAYGFLPADSLGIDYDIYWDAYHETHYAPLERAAFNRRLRRALLEEKALDAAFYGYAGHQVSQGDYEGAARTIAIRELGIPLVKKVAGVFR